LGAAQIAQGKYADGIQSLTQVSGTEADTRTAHLWTLFAQSKQGSAPASAPPAAPPPSH
jgi:hypothetical protein